MAFREPFRDLVIASPHTRGWDVLQLQQGINARFHDLGIGDVGADSDFGHESLEGARKAGYYIGAPDFQLTGPVRKYLQRILANPDLRTDAEKARGAKRYQAYKEDHQGADAALAWARTKIGITESPAESNRGPQIDVWQRSVQMLGQPWCGAFAHYALMQGGCVTSYRLRYVPYIYDDGRAGRNGLEKVVSWSARQPGDLICLFGFEHVEVLDSDRVHSIGGNTSSGSSGSQSNGGGVFRRQRDSGSVSAVVRPRW